MRPRDHEIATGTVEICQRLVEYPEPRRGCLERRERGTSALTRGEIADAAVGRGREPDFGQQVLERCRAADDPLMKAQVLGDRELLLEAVQVTAVRNVAAL